MKTKEPYLFKPLWVGFLLFAAEHLPSTILILALQFSAETSPPLESPQVCRLYLFPRAAIANYHKLSGLNQHKFILSQFKRPEVQNQDVSGGNGFSIDSSRGSEEPLSRPPGLSPSFCLLLAILFVPWL